MERTYNIATGIFPGFNDKQGIMLCGYEWGGSDEVSESAVLPNSVEAETVDVIFSNKAPRYGTDSERWPYDRKVRDWFRIWGHELRRDGVGGDFEKSIVQTNWCDTQAPNMTNVNYQSKLLDPAQIENFIQHLAYFEPRVLMFFGSAMGQYLNASTVKPLIQTVLGKEMTGLKYEKLPFSGRRFNVGFQTFERCHVVSLPHPSGSRGLSPDYIGLFSPVIGSILNDFKTVRGFNSLR
jgi:hypothetical protein